MALNPMNPAFAGMKADMGDDRVETFAAAADIQFGAVVGAKDDGTVETGKQSRAVGIAVHSHGCGANYAAGDAVSVMTHGHVWALCADADDSKPYAAAKFNAQGEIDSTASDELKGAVVRDVKTLSDGKKIALIECHSPLV